MEEEQKILKIDLPLDRTIGQVLVHQVQGMDFLVGYYVTSRVRICFILYRASLGIVRGRWGETQEPIGI
jgi:hypothetical protein